MKQDTKIKRPWPVLTLGLSFFLVEGFAFCYLREEGQALWPLAFGALWAVLLTGIIRLLPNKAGRIAYGILYYTSALYAMIQTGYYILFSEMMWLTDFRYASEGSDYFTVLLSYPISWWLCVIGLTALGVVVLRHFPRWKMGWKTLPAALLVAAGIFGLGKLPEKIFAQDRQVKYARSDYSRVKSAEAAYTNMFNAHRLWQICGVHQTLAKDIYTNYLYPLSPGYARTQKAQMGQIDSFLSEHQNGVDNEMTGLLAGKNVVLVLMESMDDWMIGEHTPTLQRMMEEGINFTQFYTPVYGSVRTFNSEFCVNTGSYLSSAGGYAFDYVTNTYSQSLANQLENIGYSAKTFHYNDPNFYSRGVFSPAMGYEEYVYYGDYLEGVSEEERKNLLYDDQLLFDNEGLNDQFFRQGQPTLNFIITRSAHLSYKYNEVLSYWGLKRYPEYRNLTDNEETNCALLKAKLVDDLFARLLEELEEKGQLENTVIIGVTDHYTYGYKNEDALLELSGVDKELLLEKTPCFLWSPGLEARQVDKTLATCDLLPTLLNLMGVDSPYSYLGQDAFDENYPGYALFSDGSWIRGNAVYDASTGESYDLAGKPLTIEPELVEEMTALSYHFIQTNNLILKTDYYKRSQIPTKNALLP